jgi:pyridoxal phosphate enzyme (YggS family)
MSIKDNLNKLKALLPESVTLVAVTKTHPVQILRQAYEAGHKQFGENKVQELCEKQTQLPSDIEWHLIGHLQSNKVKFIAPFVHLIHSVDSLKLLVEIDKQAKKIQRSIDCLLQVYIATEDTKFGLSFEEALDLLGNETFKNLSNVRIAGLMGMASNTDDKNKIRKEFNSLKKFFDNLKSKPQAKNVKLEVLSMGMSSDYQLAIEEGSTLVRVGSAIFGSR